ncbi:unnamed protein product, partial [Polarella glacialis]
EGLSSSKSSLPSKQHQYNGILAKTSKEARVHMLPSCTSALWQGMVRNLPAVLILHLCQELHPESFLWHFKACSCKAMPTLRKRALMGIGPVALTGLRKRYNVAAWLNMYRVMYSVMPKGRPVLM